MELESEISTGVQEGTKTFLKSPGRGKQAKLSAIVSSCAVASLKNMSVLYMCMVLLAGAVLVSGTETEWLYSADGGEYGWAEACKGKKQSPIDIVDKYTVKEEVASLNLINYDKVIQTQCVNTGHTVELLVNPGSKVHILENDKEKESMYDLQDIQFHWESEHTRNGKRFPLEMHLVHEKRSKEGQATDKSSVHKILVLAVFFDLDEKKNLGIASIQKSLKSVIKVGSISEQDINLRSFLPTSLDKFFRYDGSLTTPSCDETVQWTMFESSSSLSTIQYNAIKAIETFNGSNSMNFRHTQPVNERSVWLCSVAKDQTAEEKEADLLEADLAKAGLAEADPEKSRKPSPQVLKPLLPDLEVLQPDSFDSGASVLSPYLILIYATIFINLFY